ncbi:hypothetical protein GCM10028895_08300 [Pontibacter rugosus]
MQSLNPTSGIISFRNLEAGVLPFDSKNIGGSNEVEIDFKTASEKILREFVNRMLDPNEPIRKTKDLDVCQWCAYRGICAR